MDFNEYYLECHARELLRSARETARREAMVTSRASLVRPALAAAGRAMRGLYVRWSSAVSRGSKPTAARAWSRSR